MWNESPLPLLVDHLHLDGKNHCWPLGIIPILNNRHKRIHSLLFTNGLHRVEKDFRGCEFLRYRRHTPEKQD